jgi:hypothetical protein
MATESREESLGRWRHLTTAVEANASELGEVVAPARRLAGMLGEVGTAISEQATHRSSKQQTSKRIQDLMNLGRKLATLVETALRERYGNQSEKLAEFKIQPFRPRRTRSAEPTAPEAPAPVEAKDDTTPKE